MPYEKLQLAGAHSEVLSWANHEFSIEEQNMLRNLSRLPCLFKHVALMPDAHLGKGSMVGSVVATKEAVIPATVGVDIGCGMMAVKKQFQPGSVNTRSRLTSPRTGTAGATSKNFTKVFTIAKRKR
jgi:tRNA-splicing ligase RtcB